MRTREFSSAIENRMSIGIALLSVACMALAVGLFGGCAQSNKQGVDQGSKQESNQRTATTPISTQQQEQMAPKHFTVQVIQHPERPDRLTEDGWKEDAAGAGIPGLNAACAGDDHKAYTIGAITVNITEGGSQTPSIGGTVTGTSTGTQTPTQTPTQTGTQYPTQHIQPETSASVPIAVGMPGSSQSQQSTATGPGANGSPTASQTNANPANYTNIRATPQALQQAIDFLNGLKQQATSQPAATQSATP